jgi:hypothetical protein
MIELTSLLSNLRITFDIKDIRAIVELNQGSKIYFYSDLKLTQNVSEDYDTVIKSLKKNAVIEAYLNR